jgi:hypothetical protein
MSHEEIFNALWSGPGPGGSAEPERVWASAESTLNEVVDTLTRGVAQARGGWSGTAAENAATSVRLLADWADVASADASRLKNAVVAQGEYVEYARNTMPRPVEDPGGFPWLAAAIPGGTPALADWQAKEVVQSTLQQQAAHVMETYQNNTEQNKPNIQAFATPAAVTNNPLVRITEALNRVVDNELAIKAAIDRRATVLPGGPDALPPAVPGATPGGGGAPGVPGAGAPAGVPAGGVPPGVPGSAGGGGAVGLPPVVGGAIPSPPGQTRPGPGTSGGRLPTQGTTPGAGRVPQVPGSTGVPSEPTTGGRLPGGGIGGTGSPSSRGLPGGIGGVEPTSPRGGIPGSYGGIEPRTGTPGGIPAEGEAGRPGIASSTPASNSAARSAGSHGFFPPGGGGGVGGQGREHRRAPYLVDDTDAFGDDRYFTPAVITEADYVPRRT